MKKIKSQKGITIVSLIVTIIIMLILSTVIVVDMDTGSNYKRYKLMCADVELLEDKILLYYNEYGELPIGDKYLETPEQLNNGHEYYKIDLTKLSNITLNFGEEEDVFIVDTTTFDVYYKNGIIYNDVIYYSCTP